MKGLKFILLLVTTFAFAQNELEVMSYNIRFGTAEDGENNWENRKEKVSDLINYYEADFVGLQEVQKFQLDFILQKSSTYETIGLPREAGELAEYSCILFNKNNYELIQQKTLWLSETPEKASKGWDAVCYRIVTYGLFKHKKNKTNFWIINTHLDHVGKTARLESVKLISLLVEKIKKEKEAKIILTGDFNSLPEDENIQYLLSIFDEASKNSKTIPYGEKGTWNGFDFNKIPEKQIDFIFLEKKSKLIVKKFKTISDFYSFKYPSDHLPILATINY